MANLTIQQRNLFDELHNSRQEDLRTFKKKSYRGIWNSVVEKYPESAHFIYELLQNADDAEATEVYIIVNKHEMIFKHNGKKHFDVTKEDAVPVGDINSITGIGNSSKENTENKIGKFGVGFKAVFQYTDTPEIYDDHFKFKIENYIVPTLLPYDHPKRKEGETLFLFPFKEEVKAYNDIIMKLNHLENPILFLRHLEKIVWRIDNKNDSFGDEQLYSKTLLEKEEYDDNVYLEKYKLQDSQGGRTIFLFSKDVEIIDENKKLPISVGFYYDEQTKLLVTNTLQNIFCFFPTKETFKTCFISHGPFLLTDNRQNLKPDDNYNKTIIRYIAKLAASAVVHLRDYGIKHNNLLIDENIAEIVPQYNHSYWESIDELFEEPIKDAFSEIIESEEIFITRNNEYLRLEDTYTAAPRELEGLLNQKQLSSLLEKVEYDDKQNADFLKWELSQNISKRNDEMFDNGNCFTSEYFGTCITEEFMDAQDFRWVIRFYNFLRSAAPKQWRIFDREKNAPQSKLVFRRAPIIKTQKGEWVPPYLDVSTPNVYLPLKKDVSSEYNFVDDEYLLNDSARRFFDELNIKEPDEFDYIQSVILRKFRSDEFEINDEDIQSDFDIILAYYKQIDNPDEKQKYIALLSHHIYLVGDDGNLNRPDAMFISYPMLEEYYVYKKSVVFADIDFYSSAIDKYGKDFVIDFMAQIGVRKYPYIEKQTSYSTREISEPSRSLIHTGDFSSYTIVDYTLNGFNDAVVNEVSKGLSCFIWNELLPGIKYKDYESLCVRYRRKYARRYEDSYFDSSFKCNLITMAWVYSNDGRLCSPKNMFIEDLAPEYNRNNGLVEFLGMMKRERPVILEMGGTEEQQKNHDFGKRIKELFSEYMSEDEIIKHLSEVANETKSRKRKEMMDEGEVSPSSTPTNAHQSSPEETIEKKLEKKWEKKAAEKISRPHSVSTKEGVFPGNQESPKQEVQSIQPFFDNTASTSPIRKDKLDDNAIEKKLKSREEEAKEKAEKTSEMVQILELLNNEKRFSFKWYKLLMELMHANRSEIISRNIQIDFSEWNFICSDKILHLTNPSAPVPGWVADAENIVITSLGVNSRKIDGIVVKTDDSSVDISIEKDKSLDKICSAAKSFRLSAENSSYFIDSLEKRFIQLGFEDNYDLNENLTKDIQFIYGPPGTGKTTRIVEMVNNILSNSQNKTNILVLTPTNKAADVVCLKMVEDNVCYNYLTRFGATESLSLIEDAAVVANRDDTDMDLLGHNIIVTTAARYAYDYLQPDDIFICDYPWDYIIIDEASMIDILTATYILYKGAASHIIISGDPKQIEPVAQNDMPTYNVYDLVGLHGFADALKNYNRYPVVALTVQHRSIPSIGKMVSRFAYDGKVTSDPNRAPKKPLKLDAIDISEINFLGFDIKEFDNIYGLTAVNGSAFQVYSAIFTYNLVDYLTEQIKKKYPSSDYSIGIVCPYRAEADAIKLMLENKPLDNECSSVMCGTVHSFQGDECDIMFVVLNPPSRCSTNSHINNENILNVAMSRARDYLFFIMPKGQVPGFTRKNDIGRLRDSETSRILNCSDVEYAVWGSSDYIESNTHVTCHMPVNVYYERQAKYDVRLADDALDVKLND